MKNKKEKTKNILKKIRELAAQSSSPIFHMDKEEVIKHLRKTREKLWEEKLASRH